MKYVNNIWSQSTLYQTISGASTMHSIQIYIYIFFLYIVASQLVSRYDLVCKSSLIFTHFCCVDMHYPNYHLPLAYINRTITSATTITVESTDFKIFWIMKTNGFILIKLLVLLGQLSLVFPASHDFFYFVQTV